jgi:trigger factor
MKTVETENEGLKRAFMLTIPAKDIEARVDRRSSALRRRCACPASARQGAAEPHQQDARRVAAAGSADTAVQQACSSC